MTNSEILKSSMLELLFENRNKAYGAYALRKGYKNRLLIALAAGLSFILLFVFILSAGKTKSIHKPVVEIREGIVIKSIEMPKEKLKVPEKTKEVVRKKQATKIATIKYTTPPEIKKDIEVKNEMAAIKELEGKVIAEVTSIGKVADNTVVIEKEPVVAGNSSVKETEQTTPDFIMDERDPQFPGGQGALKQFLARNLSSPGQLEDGEKKLVQIRFKVDKDGSVTTFEIVTSGGIEYDQEVVRVCKKMPRWLPAIQNGINVPVSYMLPITFIGVVE